jgi:hypothetical protein
VTTAAEKAADPVTYTALCRREGNWWVITVPELEYGSVTQARTLDEVPATVADLVATMTDVDRHAIEVDVKAHARADATTLSILAGVAIAAAVIWRVIRSIGPSN